MIYDDTKEMTFGLIKPDITNSSKIGEVLSMIESSGLKIVAMKMVELTRFDVETLYEAHIDKPFFESFAEFMMTGSCIAFVLFGEDAVNRYRDVMGSTNPAEAKDGTIRKLFSKSIDENSVHGSDSDESAKKEIQIFFSLRDLFLYEG